MDLTAEQQQLLVTLVEEWRALSSDRRSAFLLLQYDGQGANHHIRLPAPSEFRLTVYGGDLNTLLEVGLLRPEYVNGKLMWVDLTNRAFDAYKTIKEREGKATERREGYLRRYLDSEWMRRAYGAALAKLDEADDLLWSDLEQQRSLTTIGHLCREAMKLFAAALVDQLGLSAVEPDPTKTKNRMRAVLDRLTPASGKTVSQVLDALCEYWWAVTDIVEKQEHGSRDVQRPLDWDDARRAVFHTGVAMVEIASSVRQASERAAAQRRA